MGMGAVLAITSRSRPVLDTLPPSPTSTLLSAQEAKERLREIVEGFFFRQLRTEDGKAIRRFVVESPPGWERRHKRSNGRSAFTCGKSVPCRSSEPPRPAETLGSFKPRYEISYLSLKP
jgi:hypothetical protein